MAKCDPLFRWLCANPDSVVTLTFADVEALVGALPPSATMYRAWWGNQVDGRHVQAAEWLNAGREVEHVDLGARIVRFGPGQWRRRA